MIIEEIKPNGFCGGVKNAIKIINNNLHTFKKPVYMLGFLIHNKNIVEAFKNKGIIICTGDPINEINNIDTGTIIITAHGAPISVYLKAKEKGLDIVDTTCYNVSKIHNIVSKRINESYDVYVIGNENHPEIKGILGINPNIKIYNNSITKNNKVFVCNQTTLNYKELNDTFNEIKKLCPNALINNEVCSATRERQEAVIKNANKFDLIIIVGDKLSNNCKSLYEVALKQNVDAIKIESLDEINNYDLSKYNRIGITSGASTPKEYLQEIKNALENYDKNLIYKSSINISDLLK